MKIHWELAVKFRALGITFGTVKGSGSESLPFPIPLPGQGQHILIRYNDRGIYLKVWLGE